MARKSDDGEPVEAAMEAFRRIIQALMGAEQHVDKLETDLKVRLEDVRRKNREALESLRQMAQEMQWRIENIEEREKARGDQ